MIAGSLGVDTPTRFECDVLVIGSGAGGSAVADVLTRAGRDVLMLEEGPMAGADRAAASAADGMRRFWRHGGLSVALGAVPVAYAEGRCVGGGTEINSGILQRTPAELLDAWGKTYAIEGFDADSLQPYYARALHAVHASLTSGDVGLHSDLLRLGAERMGWRVAALERAQRYCVGTNMCSSGCPTGAKQSMSETLLPQALERGLRLVSDCRVTRLLRKGGRVTGVLAEARDHRGRRWPVQVTARDVFVCAGAVHSPALLRRSGLTRNIGTTLRMHPTVKLLARFPHRVAAHESRLPLYAVTEFMPDVRLGGSIFVPGSFGLVIAEDWSHRAALLREMDHCAVYYAMVRGRGVGTVRTLPGIADPLVRYELTPDDWRNLAHGSVKLAELMFAAGAAEVFHPGGGHAGWRSVDEVAVQFATKARQRDAGVLSIHLFGSCRPGEDPAFSATDSYGRVRGVENLVIADASQIPEAPGVNPQATVMALAYRAAEAFLARSARVVQREAMKERVA